VNFYVDYKASNKWSQLTMFWWAVGEIPGFFSFSSNCLQQTDLC
jgi:hypothetical protein